MSETDSYRRNAEECRRLAAGMKDPEHKKQLQEMADAWAIVANGRASKTTQKAQAATD